MRKRGIVFTLICVAAVSIPSFVSSAFAQATRTWVSGVGDDANPCSRTAPCKTFAGAISKTAAAGEINVLDPGGFGAVTITKAITIRADHVEAGVLVSGTNGIVVAAGPSDQVVLEGLDIEGLGTGIDGVRIISGAAVYIIRCTIHHFTGNGVNLLSSTPNSRVVIKDSYVMQNSGGMNVQAAAGSSGGVINTVFDLNTSFAVRASAGNSIGLISSVLIGSPIGIAAGGGTVASFGPSNVIGGGTLSATVPFQ
jgi:hypothetical protein